MNQRIHNLSKWALLEEGSFMTFLSNRRRTVILEVNAPFQVCLYVHQDSEALADDPERMADAAAGRARREPRREAVRDGQFLARVIGRDTIEFGVDGAFDLHAEGGQCWVYSADSLATATQIVEPHVFTRIANRRERNPHLEMMQYQARVNTERMLAQLKDESERRIQDIEMRLATYAENRRQEAPAAKVGRAESSDSVANGAAASIVQAVGSGGEDVRADEGLERKIPEGKGKNKPARKEPPE